MENSEDYYNLNAISQSFLKTYKKCPYWAQRAYLDKDYNHPETPSMGFGKALDVFLTENFTDKYQVVGRRSKEFLENGINAEGKIEVTNTEFNKIYAMAQNVLDQPVYQQFRKLDNQKIIIQEYDDLKLKAKLDYFSPKVIADLKTCPDASWNRFKYIIMRYDYIFQLAFYRLMTHLETGTPKRSITCYIIAVDQTPKTMVYKISGTLITKKEQEIVKLLKERKWEQRVDECNCKAFGICPFYTQKKVIEIGINNF